MKTSAVSDVSLIDCVGGLGVAFGHHGLLF